VYAHEAFQMSLKSPSFFSKANREPISLFKNCEKIPVYSLANGKKEIKKLQEDSVTIQTVGNKAPIS